MNGDFFIGGAILIGTFWLVVALVEKVDRMEAKYLDEKKAREVYEKSFDDCHDEIKKLWEKGRDVR